MCRFLPKFSITDMNKILSIYRWPMLALLMGLFLMTACSPDDQALVVSENSLDCRDLKIGAAQENWERNVPYGMDSIWLQGQCLFFDLAFSGGCHEHDFSLWWNGSVDRFLSEEDSIAEFTPVSTKTPLVVLYLVHTSPAEYCEALVRESHSFNLLNLEQNGFSEVVLEIHGTEDKLSYQYVVF